MSDHFSGFWKYDVSHHEIKNKLTLLIKYTEIFKKGNLQKSHSYSISS